MNKDLQGRWALVTGASSGFGVEFATLLAERGSNLMLVARRAEPMEKLATDLRAKHGVQVVVEAMDLAHSGVGAELKARSDAHGVAVDILINNAGYGVYGKFDEQPLDRIMGMLQLNVMSITELTHVYASDMARRGSGHILLVASIGGYQATPTYAAYSATKAYVLLLGEALHTELAPQNVHVSVVSPGIAATSFLEVSGQRMTPYQRMFMMQPRTVAAAGLRAMFKGQASVIPGVGNKVTIFSNRLAPRSLQSKVAYQLMKN